MSDLLYPIALVPRDGTAAEVDGTVGVPGEVAVDKTSNTLVVMDGAVPGGNRMLHWAMTTALTRTLLGKVTAAEVRDLLDLVPGEHVQAYSAALTTLAGIDIQPFAGDVLATEDAAELFTLIKQAATTGVAGVSAFATPAEVIAGVIANKSATPEGVAAAIAAGGGGAGLTLLQSLAGAGAANMDFTALSASYNTLLINFSLDLSADAHVDLLGSTNGGSSWLGAGGYEHVHMYQASGGNTASGAYDTYGNVYNGANPDSKIRLAVAGQAADGDTAHTTVTGLIKIFNLNSTSKYKHVHYDAIWTPASVSDGKITIAKGGGNILTTSAVNALRLVASSGNIAAGSYAHLYGFQE
jgi:hypothetical protein